MNCLYANHIHKDYPIYHAFMHTLKSSFHASLVEQSGLLRLQEHPIVQPRVSAWRAILWYLEQVLDVLSFYVNKAEVMYRFKQSFAVLELLCPHIDIFCINSYRCSDYYHFLQVNLYTYSFVKEYVYSIGSSQPKKKLKNQDERKEKRKTFILLLVGSC